MQQAEEKLQREDRRRREHYRYYTHGIWGLASNYHLTMDTGLGLAFARQGILAAKNKPKRKALDKKQRSRYTVFQSAERTKGYTTAGVGFRALFFVAHWEVKRMTVTVNGQTQQGCANVLEQLTQMGFDPKRVAVEKNGEIVPRAQYEATPLKEGDKLEVVRFVGGG